MSDTLRTVERWSHETHPACYGMKRAEAGYFVTFQDHECELSAANARIAELENFESRVYKWCEKRVVTAGVPENADLIDVMEGITERYLDKIESRDARIAELERIVGNQSSLLDIYREEQSVFLMQLDEARMDCDRLDKIERERLAIIPCFGVKWTYREVPPFEGFVTDPQDPNPKPLRAAIDTAKSAKNSEETQ